MARTTVPIDIVSDTICPWCFVGKRRLDKALALYRTRAGSDPVEFSVRWHPFYLGPPDGPVGDKLERYYAKFGRARVEAMVPQMEATGKLDGIAFSYGGVTGPTYLSHRLIDYVQRHEGPTVVDKVLEALFHRYFEAEGSIFTVPDLMSAVEHAGIEDLAQAKSYVEAEDGRRQVDAEVATAQRRGVNGVPDFTIGRYNVNGAQSPETLLAFLERAAREAST